MNYFLRINQKWDFFFAFSTYPFLGIIHTWCGISLCSHPAASVFPFIFAVFPFLYDLFCSVIVLGTSCLLLLLLMWHLFWQWFYYLCLQPCWFGDFQKRVPVFFNFESRKVFVWNVSLSLGDPSGLLPIVFFRCPLARGVSACFWASSGLERLWRGGSLRLSGREPSTVPGPRLPLSHPYPLSSSALPPASPSLIVDGPFSCFIY